MKNQKVIEHLHSTNLNLTNRQLATEALLLALLELVPQHQSQRLLEEYEAGIDRLAAQVPPRHQRPELWESLRLAISQRQPSAGPAQG